MAIEDLTPFGTAPKFYEGLLGADETAALQKRAQIQGLLGAGLALAQGMSRGGAPRSALQNILGSVAGGFQAAGGAYEGGLKNFQTQQQIQQAQIQKEQAAIQFQQQQAKNAAINQIINLPEVQSSPTLKAAVLSGDPKALEFVNKQLMLQKFRSEQPSAPALINQPAIQQTGVDQQVVPVQNQLQPVEVIAKESPLQKDIIQAQRDARAFATIGDTEEAKRAEERANSLIVRQRQQELSESVRGSIGTVFPTLERRVKSLETRAPSMTGEQIVAEQNSILAEDAKILADLDPVLQRAEIKRRTAGAPKLAVDFGQRTLATERAKGVSTAEEAAINAGSAASDVRAIVDVLKPYQGGPLQSLAATVGSYLPGTSLQQMSTANDVANSIRSRLAPTLRVAGSGATSDFEAKQFLNAIPSLMQTPQGRELMAVYSEKLANRAAAAADIRASMVEDGTYSLKNFQQKLKEQGFDRVFSTEEIASLTNKKTGTQAAPKYADPNTQNLLDKYAPRKPQ
jgi:hypothetical protein